MHIFMVRSTRCQRKFIACCLPQWHHAVVVLTYNEKFYILGSSKNEFLSNMFILLGSRQDDSRAWSVTTKHYGNNRMAFKTGFEYD
jgi:hypothetical protein